MYSNLPYSACVQGLYYGITIAIVSFATMMTTFVLNIHHKGTRGRQVPQMAKKIFFNYVARCLFISLDMVETASCKPPKTSANAKGVKGLVSEVTGSAGSQLRGLSTMLVSS